MKVKVIITGNYHLMESDYDPADFGFDLGTPLEDAAEDIITEELANGIIDPGDFEDLDIKVEKA